MISCTLVEVTAEDEKTLIKFFAHPGFKLLQRIVEAQQHDASTKTLADAIAAKDGDAKLLMANAHLKKAHDWATTASHLQSILEHNTPWATARIES